MSDDASDPPAGIVVAPDLVLRRLQREDASAIFALMEENRSWLEPWMPWVDNVRALEDTEAFVSESFASNDLGPVAHECGLFHQGTLVGMLGLNRLDLINQTANVGYWMGRRYAGQGYMTGGVRALADFGFSVMRLHRLEIRAATANRPSRRVAVKSGFVLEGTLRGAELLRGERRDLAVYSRLAVDEVPRTSDY